MKNLYILKDQFRGHITNLVARLRDYGRFFSF